MPDQYPTKALQAYVLRSEVAGGVITGGGGTGGAQGPTGPAGPPGAPGAPGAPWTPIQSATAPALVNSDTIVTTPLTVSRVAPAADCTAIILASGTIAGQEVSVLNESTFSVTFAAAATSHVSTGAACSIAGNSSLKLVWNSVTARWYPAFVASVPSGTPTVSGDIILRGISVAGSLSIPTPGGAGQYGVNFFLTGG